MHCLFFIYWRRTEKQAVKQCIGKGEEAFTENGAVFFAWAFSWG
jgi:hypothetical protein